MLDPEVSLAEIGLATGFADQSHFTRVFRQMTGYTPACFRETLGKGKASYPQYATQIPALSGGYLPNIG